MSWQIKAINKYTKETFSSLWTYLLTAIFLTVWYLFSGNVFHWVWIEPLDVPPLERFLYSAITFYTLGRFIYNTGFYLVLWRIFYALGDMRSYKELKRIIWLCLILIMYFWIIPAVIAVLNWIISIGYNIFKFCLYVAPSLVISTLVVGIYYYVKNNKKQPDLISLDNGGSK